MKDVYCCTQGLGHINKCPVSFSRHVLFPLKQSCRDVIVCQLYLQLDCQSTLPCGEPDTMGPSGSHFFTPLFPALCYCGSNEHVFALCSFFLFFFLVGYIQDCLFQRRGKAKFKSRLSVHEAHFPCRELWRQSLKIWD